MIDLDLNEHCFSEIKNFTHYTLENGRLWSIRDAKFVSEVPADGYAVPCGGNEAALAACLDFYHFPKGELKTDEEYAAEAREKRNQLIAETDFMAMPDYPLDEERKAAVLAYRQALRDVPEQAGFPRQIDWPVKP